MDARCTLVKLRVSRIQRLGIQGFSQRTIELSGAGQRIDAPVDQRAARRELPDCLVEDRQRLVAALLRGLTRPVAQPEVLERLGLAKPKTLAERFWRALVAGNL